MDDDGDDRMQITFSNTRREKIRIREDEKLLKGVVIAVKL